MNVLFRLPSFNFLLIYFAAIVVFRYFNFYFSGVLILGILFLFLSLIFSIKGFKLAFNVVIVLSLFCLFSSYIQYGLEYKSEYHLSHYSDKINAFYGKVLSYPKTKTLDKKFINCKAIARKEAIKRQEYLVRVRSARFDSDLVEEVSGIILVKSRYISDDIRPGKLVIIDASSYTVKGIKPCAGFNYRQFLIDKDIYYISYPFSSEDVYVQDGLELNFLELWAGELNSYLLSVYNQSLTDKYSSLVKALVLGQREGLSSDVLSSFKKSGIMHILAISGLHIGMIAFFLYLLLRLFAFPRAYIYVIIGIILIFYMFVVGTRASILRAIIMFWCFAFISILDRDRIYYNSLFLAALIVLLIEPLSLFHIGFQLSFLATFGILLYFTKIEGFILNLIAYNNIYLDSKPLIFLRIIVKYLVSLLSLTLSAQVLILPIIIYHFGGFSLVSVFTNIFIILLVQFLLVFSLFLPFVVQLSLFTEIYTDILAFIIDSIVNISNYFADLSFSYITTFHFKGKEYIFIVLYYLFILVLFNLGKVFKFFKKDYAVNQKRLH